MENRLGQRNGDMPRYFDWNENAICSRLSLKNEASSLPSEFQGFTAGSARKTSGLNRSFQLLKGRSRIGRNKDSFDRLAVMYLVNCP